MDSITTVHIVLLRIFIQISNHQIIQIEKKKQTKTKQIHAGSVLMSQQCL